MSTRRKFSLNPKIWLQRHLQTAIYSLGRLVDTPLSSFMTSAVIGIALALPMGLHITLDNLKHLSAGWETGASISLFLKQELPDDKAKILADRLQDHRLIGDIQFVDKTSAMREFRSLSGFGDALEALDSNPLPALLVIEPKIDKSDPANVQLLVKELGLLPEADLVQLDLQWVRRLQAMTTIAQRSVMVLSTLLGFAVLMIVGNTIRLEIKNRQSEIEINKLIGATNGFIRRPFLYTGIWYGMFGGLLAWLLVSLSLALLSGPISRLAMLYESSFDLTTLDFTQFILVLGGSGLLGLAGSWLAVGRHLSAIEPG